MDPATKAASASANAHARPQPDPSIGRCIYCGTTEGKLTKEHIVPFALGGQDHLRYASCVKCADITKKFEQTCMRTLFGRSRIRFNLPTRRPDERPTHVDVLRQMPDGTQESVKILAKDFPAGVPFMRLPVAGLLQGRHIDAEQIVDASIGWMGTDISEADALRRRVGGARVSFAAIPFKAFYRMLAKIAHAHAVWRLGISSFKHELLPIILGGSTRYLHFIGGDPTPSPVDLGGLHSLGVRAVAMDGKWYYAVNVNLFVSMLYPRYLVVVGECLDDRVGILQQSFNT